MGDPLQQPAPGVRPIEGKYREDESEAFVAPTEGKEIRGEGGSRLLDLVDELDALSEHLSSFVKGFERLGTLMDWCEEIKEDVNATGGDYLFWDRVNASLVKALNQAEGPWPADVEKTVEMFRSSCRDAQERVEAILSQPTGDNVAPESVGPLRGSVRKMVGALSTSQAKCRSRASTLVDDVRKCLTRISGAIPQPIAEMAEQPLVPKTKRPEETPKEKLKTFSGSVAEIPVDLPKGQG